MMLLVKLLPSPALPPPCALPPARRTYSSVRSKAETFGSGLAVMLPLAARCAAPMASASSTDFSSLSESSREHNLERWRSSEVLRFSATCSECLLSSEPQRRTT
jgi:hypothetical protein